ncbi:hypothetical protein CAEBREN_20498 [Caenorhabditis brenneri]|uniref:Sdz-33 F-box domain-containing protein n=1 Tax=Caenorhabditis brenneri TaxID=135651 RepID=G0P7Q6_CAEBE|nr:hypothetical protein CAEBREN_20498 [Caenorhabditis brenneri]
MDPISLVFLSFCSKNTKKKVELVKYSIKVKGFVHCCSRGHYLGLDFHHSSLLLYFKAREGKTNLEVKSFHQTINEIKFHFKLESDGMYIEEAKDVDIMFTVINYILNLFRTDLDIVSVFANKLSSVQALASQPAIRTAREVGLLGCHGGSNSAADLLTLYNNLNGPLKYADVWPAIDGEMGLLPKLFGAENLFAAKSAWIQEEHFLSSNSRFMLLKKSKLNEDAIISFLKQWLDGGFTRLEMMMIWFETEHWINSEQVLNSFEWKRWDPEKRSQKFEFKPLWASVLVRGETSLNSDCEKGYDIERSDGLLATVLLPPEGNAIFFHVWHKRFH